ncbi:MAG TPA: histidine kinase, partial [Nocardioidaceae bacterium]|nr:histidine kinase [Nocardioidaceae bacterium]
MQVPGDAAALAERRVHRRLHQRLALIRRFRRNQSEREALMQAAVDASFRERRRIAGDLHDGPVQEMAGLSFALSARAEATKDEHVRDTL